MKRLTVLTAALAALATKAAAHGFHPPVPAADHGMAHVIAGLALIAAGAVAAALHVRRSRRDRDPR